MLNNLQLIQKFQRLIWDDKDISAVDQFFHEDVVINSPVKKSTGTAEFKQGIKAWYIAFPRFEVYWDDFICEKDRVVARWHAEGRHEGAFLDIPATGPGKVLAMQG